jgi:hypothetical protein
MFDDQLRARGSIDSQWSLAGNSVIRRPSWRTQEPNRLHILK